MNVGTVQAAVPAQRWDHARPFRHAMKSLHELGHALASGNAEDAQNAASKLAKYFTAQPASSDSSSSQNPVDNERARSAFQAMQSALKSGDMDAARKAFHDLTQAMGIRGGHHHDERHSDGSSAPVQSSGSSSPTTQIQIQSYTLNISFTMVSVNVVM